MKRENQLIGAGTFLFCFGLLAFLPTLTGRELLILSWMGIWEVPIGISAMVVGGVLYGVGKLQEVRNASPGGADPALDPRPNEPTSDAARERPMGQPMPTVQPNVLIGQAPVSPDPKRPR
jgi:hypothetical protein